MPQPDETAAPHGTSRRGFLLGGAAAGAGALAAVGADRAGALPGAPAHADAAGVNGERVVPFYGRHQAGVTSTPGAHATYLSFNLHDTTDRDRIAAWLRLLTDDAARLTQGGRPLADLEPQLVARPAGLTITFGVGTELVSRTGAVAPAWLGPLPPFSIDRLEQRYGGGDLLVLLHGDDPTVIAHAVRMVVRDSRSFAALRWRQSGFRRAYGTDASGTTMRNLFGQLDGTANPAPDSDTFAAAVWARPDAPAWLRGGGTSLVLRRIAMDLDGWDKADARARDNAVGRRHDTGAPLTGVTEHDAPDFDAVGPYGFPVISDVSHIRRAHAASPREAIVRIAYSYDDPVEPGLTTDDGLAVVSNVGLLFGSWQADVTAQYVPIQRRLAAADLMNLWTTPIGSTVVAIPPGCAPGGFVGETLFA